MNLSTDRMLKFNVFHEVNSNDRYLWCMQITEMK